MILKGNTHTHTTRSDGKYSPSEVIEAYQELKYDFIFLTDHNYSGPYKVESKGGMFIFHGSELSNADDIKQHATYVKHGEQELKIINHPNRYKNTPKEVNRMARENGYHAVEITEHGKLYPEYFRCLIPCIASDDSHNMRMIGDSFIVVETDKFEPGAILEAIKKDALKQGGPEFSQGFVKHFYSKASGI